MSALEVFRYERKYLIPESQAASIRRFVASYLVPDRHMVGAGPHGYRVCSLYLDSPQLLLYRQTADGIKNRYKLRIRFYDDNPLAPAFLELKKRTTETIHKLRAMIARPAVERLLSGRRPAAADILSNSDASYRAISEFCDCRERLQACGIVFVDYLREAFVSSVAENVRATFDRQINGYAYRPGGGLALDGAACPVAAKGVVFEMKYNGRAPRWMHDLANSFSLSRTSYPKYLHCFDAVRAASPSNAARARWGARAHELV
jgi:SPX domain protein involved in polyphosphate accumulation